MPSGGARPGSGRKRKAEKYKKPVNDAERQIVDNLPRLIANLMQLANGVLVEEVNIITGRPGIYQKPPDRAANEYLINRIMGKPTERQEQDTITDVVFRVSYADDD